jgi:hypothetical protein
VGDLGPEEDALARVRVDDVAHLAGDGVFDVHEHLDLREAEEVWAEGEEREQVVPVFPGCTPAGRDYRGVRAARLSLSRSSA